MRISLRSIFIFILNIFIFSIVAWMIFVFLPIYLKELNFSDREIGVLISIFPLMTLLMLVPFGIISDRFSPKKVIQIGVGLLIIYLFLLLNITSFYGILISCIIGGAGSSIFLISIYTLYYRHLDEKHRGKKIGSFLFGSYGGFAFGPYLAGMLQRYWPMKSVFIAGLVLMGILFVLSFLIVDREPISFHYSKYRGDLQQKGVWLLIFVIILVGSHFGAERVAYTLFLNKNVGLSKYEIGQVFLIVGIFLGFFTIICGYIFDKKKETLMLLFIGLIISGTFHIMTVFARDFKQVIFYRLLHTSGDAFMILATNVLTANCFPNHRMGGNYGVVRTFQTLGIFGGAFFCGYLCQLFGYASAFYFSGAIMILSASVVLLKRHMFSGMLEKNDSE